MTFLSQGTLVVKFMELLSQKNFFFLSVSGRTQTQDLSLTLPPHQPTNHPTHNDFLGRKT